MEPQDLERQAIKSIETAEIEGVPIPLANAELPLRMKRTYREKDQTTEFPAPKNHRAQTTERLAQACDEPS